MNDVDNCAVKHDDFDGDSITVDRIGSGTIVAERSLLTVLLVLLL